jgi:PmbA protein
MEAISSRADEVSSMEAACSEAPSASSWLTEETWPDATLTWSAPSERLKSVEVQLNVTGKIYEGLQERIEFSIGRVGEKIAADCVTLMDDPLMPHGEGSRPFDAEGVASRTKVVIDGGELKTLLYNLKTARKDGVKTTGNASKAGYGAPVRVAPTYFFFAPGSLSLEGLMEKMGDGLVLTELEGLHSGANSVSGDFSLSAKGFSVKAGKKADAVEQITIAGNFFEMLKQVRAMGADLKFPGSNVGSPSVDIGEMAIAGL